MNGTIELRVLTNIPGENMHSREKNYRQSPDSPSLLLNYVLFLYEAQHYVEARYYHAKLMKLDPSEPLVNIVGYKLALAVMSHEIKEYERNLIEADISHETLFSLHLHYCLTFNNETQMLTYLNGLLDMVPTTSYTLETVWFAIQKVGDADLISRFIQNYLPKSDNQGKVAAKLKKQLIRTLLSTLQSRAVLS